MAYAAPVVNSTPDSPRDRFYAVAGEAITAGQFVSIEPQDGKAYLACAASGSENVPVDGIAAADFAIGDVGSFVTDGWIALNDTAIVAGDYLYLSETAGQYARAAGHVSQIVAKVYGKTDEAKLMFQTATAEHPGT